MFLLQNAELSPWNEYFRLLRLSALQANRRQTKRGKSAYPRKSHSIPAICHDSRESTTCRRISCRRHVPFRSAKIANTGLKHILISETMGTNCRSSSICPATKIKRHSCSTVDTRQIQSAQGIDTHQSQSICLAHPLVRNTKKHPSYKFKCIHQKSTLESNGLLTQSLKFCLQ